VNAVRISDDQVMVANSNTGLRKVVDVLDKMTEDLWNEN
jgi:hypothetical protein